MRNSAAEQPFVGTVRGAQGELFILNSLALRQLHAFDPASYGRTRNYLDATVSHLSPYLRHGMVAINEVRDHLRSRFAHDPIRLEAFFRQLAWRDFFEKVLSWYGRRLEDDLEQPKHGVIRSKQIPLDVLNGDTGLATRRCCSVRLPVEWVRRRFTSPSIPTRRW